jgi:hypothetical protein
MGKRKYVVVTGPVGKETGVVGSGGKAEWTTDKKLAHAVAKGLNGHVISAAAYDRLRRERTLSC